MSISVDLTGRVALVTGASGGLGAHFARVLAGSGAAVALAARRVDRLSTLAAEIVAHGGQAMPVLMDVTSADSVAAGFEAAEAALGPVDIVVNNSGAVGRTDGLLATSEDEFRDVFEVNFMGAERVAVEAARRLVGVGQGGSIINISSVLGFRVAGGVAAYAASKAALVQLTRVLALEWARHGIRVNGIAPGYIRTDLNRDFLASEAGEALRRRVPQKRFGDPEDLSGPLLLLASDASRFMTGETIVVDGGHLHSSL
jgi:NAD(P)-dependent dehydrogenase (short-subunit alcohol dehydrogenase family)